jgi:uncharacterized membrane protein
MIKLLIALLVFDIFWIYFFMYQPFSNMIQSVQKQPMQFRPIGALVAYVSLFILAFIFLPKLDYSESFLLGFLVYAVYDSTNYATLSNWDLNLAIVDSLWGGILFYLLKRFAVV